MSSAFVVYGDVINKDAVADRVAGLVAAATKVVIGWVYEDGANGWKPATNGIDARRCYWSDRELDNTNGALGDVTGNFWGEGACVVCKAGGVISVDDTVKIGAASDTVLTSTIEDAVAGAATTIAAALKKFIGQYMGHVGQAQGAKVARTGAVAADADIIVMVRRFA